MKRHFGDFHVYYVTGEKVLHGESIYVDEEGILTPYKYSPLVASLFAVLAVFPEPLAAGIWHVFNLLFLIGAAWISVGLILKSQMEKQKSKPLFLVAFFSILGIAPAILHCLNSGQVGIAILFLFVLGVYWEERGKGSRAAFFFALSAMFKLTPLIIFPYFIFRKRFSFAMFFLGWFALFHFLPAVWLGWEQNLLDVKRFLPFLASTTLDHVSFLDFKNQSVWAYFYRLFFYDLGFFEIKNHPHWLFWAGAVFFVVLYASILFSKTGDERLRLIIDCALLSILVVIFNPNAWKHNFVMLLFPYAALLAQASKAQWKNWAMLLSICIFLLFLVSNRTLIGWGARFDIMSLSSLLLAALSLFVSLVFVKRMYDSAST